MAFPGSYLTEVVNQLTAIILTQNIKLAGWERPTKNFLRNTVLGKLSHILIKKKMLLINNSH
jgi:hypothetical protein